MRMYFLFAALLSIAIPVEGRSELTQWISNLDVSRTEPLPDGQYRAWDGAEGFTEIQKTEDGFRLEILTFENTDRIQLLGSWDGDPELWYRFEIEEMTLNGEDFRDRFAEDFFEVVNPIFDPWRRALTSPFVDVERRSNLVFPPQPDEISNIAIIPCHDCFAEIPESGNRAVFEYSIEQIPVPLAADFNYDDKVDFSDFLILSDNFLFSVDSIGANAPMHFRGDANLDMTTDFEDFLILSQSFGTSQIQAAAVPEPSGAALLALALACLAGLRRRRV